MGAMGALRVTTGGIAVTTGGTAVRHGQTRTAVGVLEAVLVALGGWYSSVLVSAGLFWAVLVCTGLYWVELVFAELCCAMLGRSALWRPDSALQEPRGEGGGAQGTV